MFLLFNEPSPIPLHALMAMAALVIGLLQLCLKKGGLLHKAMGWIWVILLFIVAISSFFIHQLQYWGPYSPIHILSLWALYSLGAAVYSARKGNIERHKRGMISLYFFALIVAGAFTFLPGRVMHRLLFEVF